MTFRTASYIMFFVSIGLFATSMFLPDKDPTALLFRQGCCAWLFASVFFGLSVWVQNRRNNDQD